VFVEEYEKISMGKCEFYLNIEAQGGANLPHDSQNVRATRNVTDEVNAYETDKERGVESTPRIWVIN